MLFGHVHNKTNESLLIQKWIKELKLNNTEDASYYINKANLYNVGSMMPYMNYTPQTLDAIIQQAESECTYE